MIFLASYHCCQWNYFNIMCHKQSHVKNEVCTSVM